jgi:hypothetical protein
VLNTLDTKTPEIVRRLRQGERPLRLEGVSIINGIPVNEVGMRQAGVKQGIIAQWQDVFNRVSASVRELGDGKVILQDVGDPASPAARQTGEQHLLEALESGPTAIVLIAHSDGLTINLPDGSRFDVSQLSPEAMAKIRQNAPDVLLLSCRTGSVRDGRALARGLLDAGARRVVAPIEDVGAEDATNILRRFLKNAQRGATFDDAIDDALLEEGGHAYRNFIGLLPGSPDSRYNLG